MMRFLLTLLALTLGITALSVREDTNGENVDDDKYVPDNSPASPALKAATLPDVIVAAYNQECPPGGPDEKLLAAMDDGVNVFIWFALWFSDDLKIEFNPDPQFPMDMACIAQTIDKGKAINPDAVHFVSIGGWLAPHPNPDYSGQEWYRAFRDWEKDGFAQAGYPDMRFDGVDWDLEGGNYWDLKQATVNLMISFSRIARKDGRLNSIVPGTTNLSPFEPIYTDSFKSYNAYAALIWEDLDLWDIIDVQLYEPGGRAFYDFQDGRPVWQVFQDYCNRYQDGWLLLDSTRSRASKIFLHNNISTKFGGIVDVEGTSTIKAGLSNTFAAAYTTTSSGTTSTTISQTWDSTIHIPPLSVVNVTVYTAQTQADVFIAGDVVYNKDRDGVKTWIQGGFIDIPSGEVSDLIKRAT
eukprot:Clim_evm2s6 gene=Clim_evmTU2s6